jgi:hypothetical protein
MPWFWTHGFESVCIVKDLMVVDAANVVVGKFGWQLFFQIGPSGESVLEETGNRGGSVPFFVKEERKRRCNWPHCVNVVVKVDKVFRDSRDSVQARFNSV